MSTKLFRLKSNASVGKFRIIEFVGEDATRSLYLATKGDSNEVYWLLESNSPLELVKINAGDRDLFQVKGKNYLAFVTSGTSVAMLAKLVHPIQWSFLVPRWVALAQQVGFLHTKGRVYQQAIQFDLNSILFGERAELLPLSFTDSAVASRPFPAPEAIGNAATPASDVYSLGASLLELLGEGSPELPSARIRRPKGQVAAHPQLAAILRKATDPDPSKRYRDANLLARALASVSPGVKAPKTKSHPRGTFQLLNFLPLVLILLLALVSGLLWQGGYSQAALAIFAQPTLELDTPVALPEGALQFDVLNVDFGPDQVGLVRLRLNKGGKPVPDTAPVNFGLVVDGRAVEPLTVEKGTLTSDPPEEGGVYTLTFDSSSVSNGRGTARITARVIGASLSKTIYFDHSTPTDTASISNVLTTDKIGLRQFSITSIQTDPGRYPELTVYFGLSGKDGTIGRLRGVVLAQLTQDGEDVPEFLITPIDPGNNPVTVALAVDVSGSMKGEPLTKAQEAATDFIRDLNAKDSACIYSFSTFITRLQECSANKKGAADAIKSMEAGGDTSLYDALLVISDELAKVVGRKAIVVLGDGADTASQAKKEEALSQLKRTNIPIFAIGMTSPQFRGDILRELAQATGGAYLEAPSAADLRELYASVNGQLKNEYQIDFKSLFPERKQGTISIRLTEGSETIEASHQFSVPAE